MALEMLYRALKTSSMNSIQVIHSIPVAEKCANFHLAIGSGQKDFVELVKEKNREPESKMTFHIKQSKRMKYTADDDSSASEQLCEVNQFSILCTVRQHLAKWQRSCQKHKIKALKDVLVTRRHLPEIVNGKELSDLHIHAFQNIVKVQFPHIAGLLNSVFQESIPFQHNTKQTALQVLHVDKCHWAALHIKCFYMIQHTLQPASTHWKAYLKCRAIFPGSYNEYGQTEW